MDFNEDDEENVEFDKEAWDDQIKAWTIEQNFKSFIYKI